MNISNHSLFSGMQGVGGGGGGGGGFTMLEDNELILDLFNF